MKRAKRFIALFLAAVMFCAVMPFDSGIWNNGYHVHAEDQGAEYGTKNNPYLIGSYQDLEKIRQNPDAYFKLTADITITDIFEPIPSFAGILDGDGHSISGIAVKPATINNNRKTTGNIFDTISTDGIVKNLVLESPNVGIYMQNENNKRMNEGVAALARTNKGTVDNVMVNNLSITVSFVSGNYTKYDVNNFPDSFGGLVGTNDGTISNITLDGLNFSIPFNVTKFGGVCGINNGTVKGVVVDNSSFSSGTRYMDGSMTYSQCSPCVGYNKGTIALAWVTMDAYVYGFSSSRGTWYVYDIGAVCGLNGGTVSNSYAKISNRNTYDYQVHGIGNKVTDSVKEDLAYTDLLYNAAAASDSSIYSRTDGKINLKGSTVESEYGYVTIQLNGTAVGYQQLHSGSVEVTVPGKNTDDKYILYQYNGVSYKAGETISIQVDDSNKAGFTLKGAYYAKGKLSVKANESIPYVTKPEWSTSNTEYILPAAGFAASDAQKMENAYPYYYYLDQFNKAGTYSPKLYCSGSQFLKNGKITSYGVTTLTKDVMKYYYDMSRITPEQTLTLEKRNLKSYNLKITGITNNETYAGDKITYTIDVKDTLASDHLFDGTFGLYDGDVLLASTTVSGNTATVTYAFEAGTYDNLKLKLVETVGYERYDIPALPALATLTVKKQNPLNATTWYYTKWYTYQTNLNRLPKASDLPLSKNSSTRDAVGDLDYAKPVMYMNNGVLAEKPAYDGSTGKFRFYVYANEGSAYAAGYVPVQGERAYVEIVKYDVTLSYDYDAATKKLQVYADGSGVNTKPNGTYEIYVNDQVAGTKSVKGLSAQNVSMTFDNIEIPEDATSAYIQYTPAEDQDANYNLNITKSEISASGASGNCGESGHESELTWKCKDGVLTIEGASDVKMMNYEIKGGRSTAPWSSCIYNKVVINGGTSIGSYAFYNPNARKTLAVEYGSGANLTRIYDYAFSGLSFERFTIPDSVLYIYSGWINNSYIGSISIGSGVQDLNFDYVQFGCDLNIPGTVKQSGVKNCTVTRIIYGSGFNGGIHVKGNTGLKRVEIPESHTDFALNQGGYEISGNTPLSAIYHTPKQTKYHASGNTYAILTTDVDLTKATEVSGDQYSSNIIYVGGSDQYEAYIARIKGNASLGYIHHMVYVDGGGSRTCNKNYEAHYECAPDCRVCSESLYLDADMQPVSKDALTVDSDNVTKAHTYNQYGRCSVCGEYAEITVSTQDKEYDGQPVVVNYTCGLQNVTASYQYQCIEDWASYDNNDAVKDGLPKDAGTYRIDVTLTDGTAVIKKSIDSVTISPRRITITGITIGDEYYCGYTKRLKILSLEGTGTVPGESIPCENGYEYNIRAFYSSENAGCDTVTLIFDKYVYAMGNQPASPNYYMDPREIELPVSNPLKPLPVTLAASVTGLERDYLGDAIPLSELGITCTPVSPSNTLMDQYKSYAYSTGNADVIKVKRDKLEIVGAGTTYLQVDMADPDNFEYAALRIPVTVNRIAGSGTVSIEDWAVDEPMGQISVESETNGTAAVAFYYKKKDADDSTYTAEVPNAKGEYTIKAVFAQTQNYLECEAYDDFTIIQKASQDDFRFDVTEVNKVYGDEKFTIAAKGNVDGSSITYKSSDDSIAKVDPQTGEVSILSVGDGTVTISATASLTDDFSEKTVQYTLHVERKTLTPVIACTGKEYDGNADAEITCTLSGVKEGEDVSLTAAGASYDSSNAGTRTVTATGLVLAGNDKDNYVLSATEAQTEAAIARKRIEITTQHASDHDYTGSEIKPEVTVLASVTLSKGTDYELEYENNTNAGDNTGRILVKSVDTSNYIFDDKTLTFSIHKIQFSGVRDVIYDLKIGNEKSCDLNTIGIPDGAKIEGCSVTKGADIISSYQAKDTTFACELVNEKNNIGREAEFVLTISSTNYENYDVTITIKAIKKDTQDQLSFQQASVIKEYGDDPFVCEVSGAVTGSSVVYSVDSRSPQDVVKVDPATGRITILKASDTPVVVIATASETTAYAETSVSYAITVNKAVKPPVDVDNIINILPEVSVKSLSEIKLPEGWHFAAGDLTKAPVLGSIMELEAYYDGDENHLAAKKKIKIVCTCKMVESESQLTYEIGTDTGLILKCTGALSELKSIKMDDTTVDSSAYTLVEGSTIATMKKAYMDSLTVGEHIVTMSYPSNTVTFKITVTKKVDADKSDNNNAGTQENTSQNNENANTQDDAAQSDENADTQDDAAQSDENADTRDDASQKDKSTKTQDNKSQNEESVNTGDDVPVMYIVGLLTLCAAGMIILRIKRR